HRVRRLGDRQRVGDAGRCGVHIPEGWTLAESALRWILMPPAVTSAIPGARRPGQVEENCAAADRPPIPEATMSRVREIYDARVRALVHQCW
ncbi:MAG: hypothetical protein EHM24_19355, partial [Acidobacteria bacterium]